VRLPNAPLVEVVFELRWDVTRTGGIGPAGGAHFGYDPGFQSLENAFSILMKKAGYTSQELTMAPGPVLVWSPVKRYRKGDGSPFPLVQIGHGIFAFNSSTEYDWSSFKEQALQSLAWLKEAYPSGKDFGLRPVRAELKYIDSFDSVLLGHNSFSRFLRDNTKINYGGFGFVESGVFGGDDKGKFKLTKSLLDRDVGVLDFEVGTGELYSSTGVLLSSGVTKDQDFKEGDWVENTVLAAGRWLEAAHAVTSPFFASFVSPELMMQFNQKG
jgi:uncharacterized protein (TIGR04255 family)